MSQSSSWEFLELLCQFSHRLFPSFWIVQELLYIRIPGEPGNEASCSQQLHMRKCLLVAIFSISCGHMCTCRRCKFHWLTTGTIRVQVEECSDHDVRFSLGPVFSFCCRKNVNKTLLKLLLNKLCKWTSILQSKQLYSGTPTTSLGEELKTSWDVCNHLCESCRATNCAGRVLANTRPHHLCWGDEEMAIAISCKKGSHMVLLGYDSANVLICLTRDNTIL